jgi:transketolase
MPSWELFDRQPKAYRDSVLPTSVSARASIEAGRTTGWERYIGPRGIAIGIDRFGASAPGSEVFARFGLTAETIAQRALEMLRR